MRKVTDIHKAYAKINLYLRVLDKRTDGYHNILSLMAHVDLADLLKLEYVEIEPESSGVDVQVTNAGGACSDVLDGLKNDDNLIVKAVKRAAEVAGCGGHFQFILEKNIPAGAGLGGGSSDAAVALQLVAPYLRVEKSILVDIAAEIGADIPFHLFGGFALCEGIGEIVEQLDIGIRGRVVIANNNIHVDTGRAYRLLNRSDADLISKEQAEEIKNLVKKTVAKNDPAVFSEIALNDFEKVVFNEYPEVEKIKNKITGLGADLALMTGSGSTVVGLFKNAEAAEKAATDLKKTVEHVYLTDFV